MSGGLGPVFSGLVGGLIATMLMAWWARKLPRHYSGVSRETFDKAGLKAEIEVYKGAMHGWCPPDSQVYNKEAAEKAWSRLLALFESALA